MAVTPYSPMHVQAKAVTQEDMWETLKRHLPSDSSLKMKGSEGRSPKEKLAVAPLVWLKPVKTGDGAGYFLDQSGHFSIEKRPVRGKPMYMAWLRKDPPHESISLGIRPTRKEAERLCELEAARDPSRDSGGDPLAEPSPACPLAQEDGGAKALAMARSSGSTRGQGVSD